VIAPEQFGSRKHKRAITHCINKRLTFDHMRQLQHPGALCASDLKSCYDRVVHAIASLSMRRVGMPSEPIICMFTTIQDLEHHVRMIYGDSKKSFGSNLWLVPCQGLGQRLSSKVSHDNGMRPGSATTTPIAHNVMNGQLKGIPAEAIGPYGARLLYKHSMYQITLALYRWH
jgi:hypothetical protein